MTKFFATAATAAMLALATAAPTPAAAGCNGPCALGIGLGVGILAAGVIASQNQYPNNYYNPGYAGVHYGAPPHMVGTPGCYYTRAPMWDQYNGVWVQGPRQLVCR